MKKKLISGMILLLILICTPFSKIELSSNPTYESYEPPEPAPVSLPAPAASPAVSSPLAADNTYTLSIPCSIGTLT